MQKSLSLVWLCGLGALLAGCGGSLPDLPEGMFGDPSYTDVYKCEGGARVTVVRMDDEEIHLNYGAGTLLLEQVRAASGVKYANYAQVTVWWEKGDEAYLEIGGRPVLKYCILSQ